MIEIAIGVFLAWTITCLQGLHQIDEGYVGIYYRGGAILPGISEPGWHTKIPIMTSV